MKGSNTNLSVAPFIGKKSFLKDVAELSVVNSFYQYLPIGFDWVVVFFTITVCELYLSVPIYVLAVLIIASRQHAMLAIMHEGAHLRLAHGLVINDIIGNWFAAYPIFSSTEGYRAHHSRHHKYLNTYDDPDWSRKVGAKEWTYPQPKKTLFRILFHQFARGGIEWFQLMSKMSGLIPAINAEGKKNWSTTIKIVSYYAVVLSLILYFFSWQQFFLYWLVPLFFVFPLLQRIRSISEHFGLSYTHELSQTRDVCASGLETWFFAPHNINYHLVHHLFASVPQYNLKKLHKVLMADQEYAQFSHQNHSYFLPSLKSVLSDLTQVKKEVGNERVSVN